MANENQNDQNTGVMDSQGTEFQSMLAQIAADLGESPEPTPQAKESGDKKGSSPEPEPGEGDDPTELKKQVSGLRRELDRVRGDNRQVAALQEQITNLQNQIRGQDSGGQPQVSLERLEEMRGDWEDEKLDARVALRVAEKEQDAAGVTAAQQRLAKANQQVGLYRDEIQRRKDKESQAQQNVSAIQARAVDQAKNLVTNILAKYPDLDNQDSPLFKAAEKIWDENKEYLGPMKASGDLVAMAAAILMNPELTGGAKTEDAKTARKDLMKNLSQATENSLFKGAKTGGTAKPMDFERLLYEPGGFQKMDQIRARLTGTG